MIDGDNDTIGGDTFENNDEAAGDASAGNSHDGQSNVQQVQNFHLLEWLKENYGNDASTERLLVSNLQMLPVQEQNGALLHLLQHWFRDKYKFHYYYDQCENCGVSYRRIILLLEMLRAMMKTRRNMTIFLLRRY